METPKPYRQRRLPDGSILREFRGNTSPGELIWHQDRLERQVTVVKGRGWRLQLESGLPFPMNEGYTYTIPARSWHRIVRGTGSLVISIQERKDNMAIRLTESKLRQIIREEVKKVNEMGRYGGGRHGMSYGYGSYGSRGDYPSGGSDEYERSDEPEIDQMFDAEYPDFDHDLGYMNPGDTPESLALMYLKGMNDRNQYGYSESQMKASAKRIAAKHS